MNVRSNLKNIFYTIWANGISTIISIILSLLIPKVFDVMQYGMWQLYSFYIAYVGLMHFGWTDGVYLQFGGYEYKNLPKQYLSNQFWLMNFFEIILSCILTISIFIIPGIENKFIWLGFSACFLINSARLFILLIYQSTNRIKEYSQFLKLDRYIFFILAVVGIFLGVRTYYFLIIFDLIGKLIALIYSVKGCKGFVLKKPDLFDRETFRDAMKNISIGSKLTLGGLASSLIIGVLRQSIQSHWGIETFAKLSFILNISNMIMIFINTIGQIMFPILRTISPDKYKDIFRILRNSLSFLLLFILMGYFVGYPLLLAWLPKYEDGLRFMALLFPVYVFESKSALLYTSFFKTIRKEKWILAVNVISLIICVATIPVAVFLFDNLMAAILLYVFSAWVRNFLSDILASRHMNTPYIFKMCIDTGMIALFMLVAWSFNSLLGFLIYLILYFIYLVSQYRDLKEVFILIIKFKEKR